MQIVSELTDKPKLFHDLCQNQKFYIGNDEITERVYPKGTIIVALAGPEPGHIGYYFTNIDALMECNFDSNSLCQGVQVNPFYNPKDKNLKKLPPQYKTDARFYVLNEPVKVAVGEVTNNFHYGKGGLVQYAIPNSRNMILKNLEDPYKYNPKHTIIPVNLNDFELDPRLTTETKEKLNDVRKQAIQAGCLISGNGSIKLNNIEISKHAYLVIKFREKLHESFVKINCLKKEYVDELEKNLNAWNIDKLKEIKVQLDSARSSYSYIHKHFDNLKQMLDPNLMKGFNKENQEYLLDLTTSIPNTTQEIGRYLDERIAYLEIRALAPRHRELLGLNFNDLISKVKSVDLNDPKNPKDEAIVQEYYQKYARLEQNYLDRNLVFAPKGRRDEVTKATRRLLSQFKTKEDLQQFLGNLNVRKIKDRIVYKRTYREYNAVKDRIEKTQKELDSLNKKIPKFKTKYERDLYLIERNERGKVLKQTLIFQLKSRENLQELMEKKPEDRLITAYCEKRIKELDQQIEKNIAVLGELPRMAMQEYDEALQYLQQKAEQTKNGIIPSKDPVKEGQTEKLYQKISDDLVKQDQGLSIYKWDKEKMGPAVEAKQFCDIRNNLEEKQRKLDKINDAVKFKHYLNEEVRKLKSVKVDLAIVEKYAANGSLSNTNEISQKKYQQTIERLKKVGITNWKQFDQAKENLKAETQRFRENYKDIKTLIPYKLELKRNILKLTKEQYNILKENGILNQNQKDYAIMN